MKNIENIINEVNGTMSIEGMPITEADRTRIRTCLRDENKYKETIKDLVRKHTVLTKDEKRHGQ